MRRLPTWLKILIPALLLLVVIAAAVFMIVVGEPPEHAQVAAIQARFAEQLEFLRELAETCPLDPCRGERSLAEAGGWIRELQVWKRQAKEGADLFSDSAILGAEVVVVCADGTTSSAGISDVLGKEYQEPAVPLSRALLETPTEWPVVSLWYDQTRRLVRYEDRFQEPSGSAKGFRLIFDLDGLEDSGAPPSD